MLKATFRVAARLTLWLIIARALAYLARLGLKHWVDGPDPLPGDPRWAEDGTARPAAPGGADRPGAGPVGAAGAWVPAPGDGSVPASHPVKAKLASGIYHVPGGASYGRTRPDRCYASAEAATADGFVPAKR